MSVLKSALQLKEYTLRKLGKGILTVNVTEDQLEDRLQEALEFFGKYHTDGFVETYHILPLTTGVWSYTLPEDILAVKFIIHQVNQIIGEPTFSFRWDFMNEKRFVGELDLIGYHLLMSKLELIDHMFRHDDGFVFNPSSHVFQLFGPSVPPMDGSESIEALWVVKLLDPYDYVDIYNNDWLKQYYKALLQIQWGENLSKYSGTPLPGGGQLNAQDILNRGLADKERLEKEVYDKFTEPPSFFVG